MLSATRNMMERARRKSVLDLQVLWKRRSHWRLKDRTRVRKMIFSPLSSIQEAYICRLSWLPERQESRESMEYILRRLEVTDRVFKESVVVERSKESSCFRSNSARAR